MSIPCKIDPLGTSSIGLPDGYTRLEYLESTGTQYIDTLYYVQIGDVIRFTSQYIYYTNGGNNFEPYLIGNYSGVNRYILYTVRHKVPSVDGWLVVGDKSALFYHPDGIGGGDKINVEWSDAGVRENGKFVTLGTFNRLETTGEEVSIALFSRHIKDGSFSTVCAKARIWGVNIKNREVAQLQFVPALDPTGAPCMYDTVSKKPYYNIGTGAFIAGVETQVQLNNLLYKLPDRTGEAVGTLTVRLADELQTPENEARLDAMLAKNWEISQAA